MENRICCFVADVHLGLDYKSPNDRESKFVDFLRNLPSGVTDLFLLGDIFDFWYEYKYVIPNKFIKTLSALSDLTSKGVKIHFFNGNHDIWTYRFFQQELGVEFFDSPCVLNINGKKLFLAHGDALWERDKKYLVLQKIFKSKFLQFLFSSIHPRWAFSLGYHWSKHNRLTHDMSREEYESLKEKVSKEGKDWAEKYQKSSEEKVDYFIMGHYHIPLTEQLEDGSQFLMLGDWIHHPDYLILEGDNIRRVNLYL